MKENAFTFGYEKQNTDIIDAGKVRICGYFVISDLHKISPTDLRLRKEELLEEIEKHEEWILESIIWDANHKADTNREGLNTILGKAKKNEFDILLVHHMTLISRQGGKIFDYALELHKSDKSIYGIVEGMQSLDVLADTLRISGKRRKLYEAMKDN